MTFLLDHKDGALIHVHARPGASRTALVGTHGDALKVAVQAPPVENAANEAIRDLLATALGLPRSCVKLRSGTTSRKKTFQIPGVTAAEARRRLEGKF